MKLFGKKVSTTKLVFGILLVAVAAFAICMGQDPTNVAPVLASAPIFTEGLCEKVQASMNQLFRDNSPALKRTAVGYLQAVTSGSNTAGVEQIPIDPGNGKKRQVRIKYYNRGVEDDITDEFPTTCDTELEKTPLEETVDIEQEIWTKGMRFNETEMRKLCEPDSEWMANIINSEVDPLMVLLNKRMLAIQAANFGKFNPDISPATFKDVTLLKTGTLAPVFIGESQIMEDMENLDTMGARPILIGAGYLGHYVRQVGIGCCNDNGLDIGRAGNFDYYRDRFAAAILGGSEHFAALVPGYVQLLTYNRYVGTYKKDSNTFSHGTIVDPMTGIQLDMKWHYNDCDDTYSVRFGVAWDMYFLPANAFATGDELEGVNFTLHYRATLQA